MSCAVRLHLHVLFSLSFFFLSSQRAPQDKIHSGDGGSYPGDDTSSWDRAAKGHHPHLLWHDAMRVPLHNAFPTGVSFKTWTTAHLYLKKKDYM